MIGSDCSVGMLLRRQAKKEERINDLDTAELGRGIRDWLTSD